jgi:hypothetical protein
MPRACRYGYIATPHEERIIDRHAANIFGGNDMRLRRLPQDRFQLAVSSATVQEHQYGSRWHPVDGALHMTAMTTMDDHLRCDAALLQELINLPSCQAWASAKIACGL